MGPRCDQSDDFPVRHPPSNRLVPTAGLMPLPVTSAADLRRRRPGEMLGRPNREESDRQPDHEPDDDVAQRSWGVERFRRDERGGDAELGERHDDLPTPARDTPVGGFHHRHTPCD